MKCCIRSISGGKKLPLILLVTIEDNNNLGNRLQHYATQKKIQSLGYTVDSLMIKRPVSLKRELLKKFILTILVNIGFQRYRPSLSRSARRTKNIIFNKRYISRTLRMTYGQLKNNDWSDYKFAVTGSDQVWHNWHNRDITDELTYYYLQFIEKKKRVSYAPSFGFSSFPEEDLEAHRSGLMGMSALSCREHDGCKLIKELTGRKAKKVLDPTLLLTQKEWEEIESKPKFKSPERFLLQFFLGDVKEEFQQEIKRICDERGLEILNVNDKSDPTHFAISPSEFVWLIHHADTVCTDSFHASAFSITFERRLRVFRRQQEGYGDMFGRLNDLLAPLGLSELVFGKGSNISTVLDDRSRAFLESERQFSLKYLKQSLTIQ